MRIALIAAALFAVASPGFAQTATPGPAPATKPAEPKKGGMDDPNRIVCKREHVVGSNRPQKVCMTVAQRQRLKDQADLISDPGRQTPGTESDFKSSGGIGG
ncbi:MAG: hypothetical protein GC145_15475 [Caulobacter sp.]|nr:hypothetical protein [Caulobacter sp.]